MTQETNMLAPSSEASDSPSAHGVKRRSFLKGMGIAGATLAGGSLLSAAAQTSQQAGIITSGDVAILRFLAAAELIEADLWQQYAELGGLTPGQLPVESAPFKPMNSYQAAFMNLDGDGPQYISSNTLDEASHAAFLNAYLISIGAEPVDLDAFRNLPSSEATGAQQIGRLTNLMNLTVDTSWYTRYRSSKNPDFGATFPQAIDLVNVTAIPRTNADFKPKHRVQAIANTAAFHFGTIEQGGSSLYSAMAQKATNLEVLRIVVSIGGDEVAHFLEWVDFAGNGVQPPIAPFTDPVSGLTFPNFDKTVNPSLQTNLIFPVPCEFVSPNLPACAVIRPTNPTGIASGVVDFLTAMNLFDGQSSDFFKTLEKLAKAADAARRGF
ncbi:MAG TPA: twin-arginine translocation signal domain-containing protein [Terriglobales bacterium]|nr:twin-arginine translocation signal domain-containing protein [Terriglobales bacterium]